MSKRLARYGSSRSLWVSVSCTLVALILTSVVSARAENAVYLECPVMSPSGTMDSIGIRVFVANDTNLYAFTLGFWLRTDKFVFSSAQAGPAIMEPMQNGNFLWRVFPPETQIAVAWYSFLEQMPYPVHPAPENTFTLWFKPTSAYNGECINIDSGYVSNGCIWKYYVQTTHNALYPAFYDCDSCEVLGAAYECGDLDASGQQDIADVVYLVNYIFAGGPAPQDREFGDVDCSQRTDIVDAVFIINYIFAGGAAPCAACP